MTVTGKTMAENLAAIDPPRPDGVVVHPLDAPIHTEGGINVLHRLAGAEGLGGEGRRADARSRCAFEGTARVFDGEDGAMAAILAGYDRARHGAS